MLQAFLYCVCETLGDDYTLDFAICFEFELESVLEAAISVVRHVCLIRFHLWTAEPLML